MDSWSTRSSKRSLIDIFGYNSRVREMLCIGYVITQSNQVNSCIIQFHNVFHNFLSYSRIAAPLPPLPRYIFTLFLNSRTLCGKRGKIALRFVFFALRLRPGASKRNISSQFVEMIYEWAQTRMFSVSVTCITFISYMGGNGESLNKPFALPKLYYIEKLSTEKCLLFSPARSNHFFRTFNCKNGAW